MPSRTTSCRAAGAGLIALAVGGGALLAVPALAASDTLPPKIVLNLPSTVGNGGEFRAAPGHAESRRRPGDFTGTLKNATGSDYDHARLDFVITPPADSTITASDLKLEYKTGDTYQTIPLSQSAAGKPITGSFGPATGFPLANGADNTTGSGSAR